MNLSVQDVLSSMQKGEGSRLEFKRVLPRDDKAARTLCAFANTRGGLLLVGITDRGRVHGVHRPEQVGERLCGLAQRLLEPALGLQVQVLEIHGPRVVACSVPLSKERPHALLTLEGERQFLVRVGSSNRIAEGATLAALRLARRSRRGLSPLEESALEWVARHAKSRAHPAGTATAARFAKTYNLSENRARRAFVKLESLGLVFGHGGGRGRIFAAP